LLKFINQNKKQDFTKDFIYKIFKKKYKVYGYKTSEYIKDLGTIDRIKEAKKDLKTQKYLKGNIDCKIPAIFLDRDGVINFDKNDGKYQNCKNFIPGSLQSIKKINKKGFLAIILTNQPAVAKGYISLNRLKKDFTYLTNKVSEFGGYFDDIFYCIHHPKKGFKNEIKNLKKNCINRKPNNGMFLSANKIHNIDFSRSYMIGDRFSDFLASKKTGVKFISVGELEVKGCTNKKNLKDAINYLLRK
jgi:D,D-heptose 1,7-bisphosphate phosphatase